MTTARHIESMLINLARLTEEDHPELDGATRDEISHIRHVLWTILDRRDK